MEQPITVVVAGELHPDLFGGMTPMMVPMEFEDLAVYRCRVSWTERNYSVVDIVATSEEEASAKAEDYFAEREDGDDYETDDVSRVRDATSQEIVGFKGLQ